MRWNPKFNSMVTACCLMILTTITLAVEGSVETLPVADEMVLFESGNPQPWETRTSGVRGGKSERLEEHARIRITATRKDSGGGVSLPSFRRFDPTPYLQDACMRIAVKYRVIGTAKPQKLKAMIRTMAKKEIGSLSQPPTNAQRLTRSSVDGSAPHA